MVIAVTHENNLIFQHFGRSPEFAIYLINEEGNIVRKNIVSNDGYGHEGLADVLMSLDVDVLICGGIGGGAISILHSIGINVFPGVSGNVDETIESFLKGSLVQSNEPTCSCNEHEGENSCDCGDDESDHNCGCHCHNH